MFVTLFYITKLHNESPTGVAQFPQCFAKSRSARAGGSPRRCIA